jgi:hypothetical protein
VSIEGRLRRLEESRHGGACPECGLSPEGKGHIVLIDERDPERSFKGDPEERCVRCGRPQWCVIEVVYGDDSPASEATEGGG